jgi:hypothetical protein
MAQVGGSASAVFEVDEDLSTGPGAGLGRAGVPLSPPARTLVDIFTSSVARWPAQGGASRRPARTTTSPLCGQPRRPWPRPSATPCVMSPRGSAPLSTGRGGRPGPGGRSSCPPPPGTWRGCAGGRAAGPVQVPGEQSFRGRSDSFLRIPGPGDRRKRRRCADPVHRRRGPP